MSDLETNAQEDKDPERPCDSPGPTQEPLQSHTLSPKNNAEGPSADEHGNPLNGAQPNPFVHSGVPAVPRAGDPPPPGPLVNGPGSHPTSEVRRVLNKGAISSNNVPDAARRPRKDGSPQVLPPPAGLQSDAWRSTAGPVLKTPPARPGADNTPPSDSEENRSEPVYSARPPGGGSDRRRGGRTAANEAMKMGSLWDLSAELSGSSSDDCDDGGGGGGGVIGWYSQKELICSLWNGIAVNKRSQERSAVARRLMSHREKKHSVHTLPGMPGSPEKLHGHVNQTHKHFRTDYNSEAADERASSGNTSDAKYSVEIHKGHSGHLFLDTDQPAHGELENGYVEENDPEAGEEDGFSTKPERRQKTERPEQDQALFPCAICNVNFQEQGHLHRHMMYHLDGHNRVHNENIPQPFICRECGRSFCDSNSLVKHIIIHQERLEKLMEEIKGLKKLENEGKDAKLQCPHCAFESNCRKTLVRHAKTHENVKRYYCCEECDYFALTHHALEAHLHTAHLNTHQSKHLRLTPARGTEVLDPARLQCLFTDQDKHAFKRHSELEHQEWLHGKCKTPVTKETSACADSTVDPLKFTELSKIDDSKPAALKTGVCNKRPAFLRSADFTYWSSRKADLYGKRLDAPNSYKSLNASQFKSSGGCTSRTPSPDPRRTDKRGKLPVQSVERINVTTGLPYVEENKHTYDHRVPRDAEQTDYPSSATVPLAAETIKADETFREGNAENAAVSFCSQEQATHKSPSKRKMTTPFHNNAVNMMNNAALFKRNQRLEEQRTCDLEDSERDDEDSYDFSDYTSEATANFLDCSENEKNPYARSYFIRRQRFSVKEDAEATDRPIKEEEDGDDDDDCSDIQQLVIKEEYIESAVCEDSPGSPAVSKTNCSDVPLQTSEAEHKACPYCPAVFESGVGLSNHVRGHLHRVGLSYNARHMVSPEQVALQDCQPRIRRKIPSGTRRLKKADKTESQGEHTCPLCWGWFDTKTGLSNHVRGHLKRIGKSVTSDNKSPVCILNELLQDKEEHQNILQILNRKQFPSRPFVSQKFISSNGLFLMPTGIPVKIQYGMRDITPWSSFVPKQEAEVSAERMEPRVETQGANELSPSTLVEPPGANEPSPSTLVELQGANEPSPSTLVELLKTRERDVETKERDVPYATSKHFNTTKERRDETQPTGECDSNKRICIHCNTIFPSAVSLSNHLRAYARRKRIAILEGTSYDFKQKKPRSRPGLKKKVFPSLNTVEEIYRLTCRFCDLVFQGPLSVQEDWIKHLQRHLMHTSVPRSGTGMVEVLGLHQDKRPMPPQHPSLEQHLSPREFPMPPQHPRLEQHLSPLELPVAS